MSEAINAPAMPKLIPYSEHSSCPKCECTLKAEVTWHPGRMPGITIDGCGAGEEHLHVTCARCGYNWIRAPREAS